MTRTLYLLRHAKSSWDDPDLPDHDRPLAPRGLRNLGEMGPRWAARGVHPDRIVSSTAVRALSTARAIAEALGLDPQHLIVDGRIYATSPAALLDLVVALDDGWSSVMLVGHNPEFTELAQRFSPEIEHLPTCALAEFVFNVNAWADLRAARPCQTRFESPKRLMNPQESRSAPLR